jgi:hypothetical protein
VGVIVSAGIDVVVVMVSLAFFVVANDDSLFVEFDKHLPVS